ncbi:hypothetical protein FE391_26465 [Nonomuraea sp. KC401]|nr:hypothetical protein FE391_26465 [Nonomuraea sp. KC401]
MCFSSHAPAERGYNGPDQGCFRARHYQDVWSRARKTALSEAERASHVARRPYDLRHFNASMLNLAGVDAAQVARRLGHSVRTLWPSTSMGSTPGRTRPTRGSKQP